MSEWAGDPTEKTGSIVARPYEMYTCESLPVEFNNNAGRMLSLRLASPLPLLPRAGCP